MDINKKFVFLVNTRILFEEDFFHIMFIYKLCSTAYAFSSKNNF
jgi:hypothetical protein